MSPTTAAFRARSASAASGPLRAGFAAVRRSKRLILLSATLTAVLSLPVAIYVGREVHSVAARRPDATNLALSFDPDMMTDLRSLNPSFDASLTALIATTILIYLLTRPLLWGGYCGVASTSRRLPFATFLRDGGASYWKFLRIAALGGVALLAVVLATKPVLTLFESWRTDESSETLGERYQMTGHIVALSLALLVKLILDHTKVGVRLHRRPGVLVELGRSALFVMQHPLRTVGAFAVARGLEALAMFALARLLLIADGAYIVTSFTVVLLGVLLVAAREATSLFHLAAAWHIRMVEDAPPPPPAPIPEGGEDILDAPLPWRS